MKKNITLIVFLVILVLPVFSQQNSLPRIETIRENIQNWLDEVSNSLASDDILFGIGVGNLSTAEASIEQAKFNANADICRQLSTYVMYQLISFDDAPKDIVDRLEFYQNKYYEMVSLEANNQACFALYGLTTVERRARTADGNIWYVVSLDRNKAKEITGLGEYVRDYFNSVVEDFERE
jgi:hypothetical protein